MVPHDWLRVSRPRRSVNGGTMVSRYGVTKDGAMGVASMHCLLPHCGGPHHLSPHPQNTAPTMQPHTHHNHVHPHNHQPPPPPSPHGHLNHLNHAQHQLTINIGHHQHQNQQTQHQQAPPQYRIISAAARSDFHVPGQNYGAQPGGQVGGGGGNVGVPGGRGPPPLGGIPLGQSTTGLPPGGPAAGQQAPPQPPTPGVQSQQPQGPAPTTTPPVHTPSPQEMGKQGHLQTQPIPVFVPNPQRPANQGYYASAPRPQQPRGMNNHRGGQSGGNAPVLNMSGVAGNGTQQLQYAHPNMSAMYVQSQVSGLQHQQPVNFQIPTMQFRAPHQAHHNQGQNAFYQTYHHPATTIIAPNLYAFQPPHQAPYYQVNPAYLRNATANAVNSNTQHMQGQLANAQGNSVVPQGSLQQPAQPPQPMPAMTMPIAQTEVYSGHNGGAASAASIVASKKTRRSHAIPIIDPKTGASISNELYESDGSISGEGAPHVQNCDKAVIADFAAMVAKAATEPSSDSPVATSAPESPTSQNTSQSLPNLKVQTSSNVTDTNSQSNTGPPTPTQSLPGAFSPNSQSLPTSSNPAQLESCPVKVESKPLQPLIKEFQPRGADKPVVVTEELQSQTSSPATLANKDKIPTQTTPAARVPAPEVEVKSTILPPQVTSQTQIPSTSPSSNIPDLPLPSATVLGANPVPAKEPFPNLVNKNKSSSPPRRKSQNPPPSNAITIPEMPPLHKEPKEQKERKVNEKNVSSRGTTPTPVHNLPEQIHPKTNGETGDKPETETLPKNEAPQKTSDGGKSAMQKQKNKSKLKGRDINRRGAEKEGTDMDAFVNAIPPTKVESKPEVKEAAPQRDSNKESAPKEITKDIKEKDNHESKKEKQVSTPPQEKQTTPEVSKESTPIIENPPTSFNHKESKPTIEESSKPQVVSNMAPVPNDVVDHSVSIKSDIELTSIVAQKNEENSKVSALRASSEEKVPAIEKQDENAAPNQLEPAASKGPVLKYTYQDDQWSPLNTGGKRVYGREFLMKLQEDPNSKIKPLNLPDLDVVLKDNTKARQYTSRNRSPELRPFKDQNMGRHDNLFPGFANTNKNSMNSRMGGMLPINKKSNPGNKLNRTNNSSKQVNVISLSLGLDVKLRESENAWKPTRLKAGDIPEEQAVTQTLYKKVRSVLNKLTPQKFDTLVSQVRALAIDTKERMDGVINLVFEKAIDEPSFSVAYALMCKELAQMQVSGTEPGDTSATNFRKSIITRCQSEFEKDSENEKLRVTKAKEIEECTDTEKKKELQAAYEDEERRIRMKSVGNIRFIGELFKQGMLTKKIMHFCIHHLLQHRDEENLECLCKLLTTIGKNLETNDVDLKDYIKTMNSIVNDKGPNKISSRVRFMIQDVIDLRSNKWVPRRDDSNPKTMDQIQREAESERLDAQFNTPFNTPINTPRKDDRGGDRRRNRGMGGGNSEDGGWIHPSKTTRTAYSVETSKLKNKPPSMDDLQLGSRNAYVFHKNVPTGGTSVKTVTPNKFACLENMSSFEQDKRPPLQLSGSRSTGPREYGRSDYKSSYEGRSSRNGSHQLSSGSSSRESSVLDSARSQSISMPPPSKPAPPPTSISNKPKKSEDELRNVINMIVEEYIAEGNNEDVLLEVKENFSSSQLPMLVHEMGNVVIEKSSMARERISRLLSFLLLKKAITLNDFRDGFGEILEIVDDLVIDIPKIWTYLADIMMYLLIDGTHPVSELKTTVATLRSKGLSGKLIGELFSNMSRIIGQKSVAEKWRQSGLQFSDIINTERENVDEIIKNYELQFLSSDCKDLENKVVLKLDQIHTHLKQMMKDGSSFDDICSWITSNVGDNSSDPQFIRVLVTAILEASTVFSNNRHDFKADIFQSLQRLIQRFVDANEKLELQCLFAAQAFANKLEFPSGLLLNIFDKLCEDNIISFESFIQWETNDDAAEREGKAVALKALTSFFTSLKEAEEFSEEESITSGQSTNAVRA